MKKTYIKPEMETVLLQAPVLMAGSVAGSSIGEGYATGNSPDNNLGRSLDYDDWDEEGEY